MLYRTIGGVLILIGAMLCGAAQAAVRDDYSGTVAGVVIDATGQPAAGANVWLVVDQHGIGAKVYKKTVADGAGRFEFPHVKLSLRLGTGESTALVARDAKGRIGTERPWSFFAPPGEPPRPNIQIRLAASKDLAGRLVDVAGKPIAGASIATRIFSSAPMGCCDGDEVELFPELSNELTAKTDAGGRFVLRGIPSKQSISATITAAGFGEPRVAWLMAATPTIELQPPGKIVGKAVVAKSAVGIAGVPMFARLWRASPDGKWGVDHSAIIVTDKVGQFTCENLPPGSYRVGVLSTGNVPYYLPMLHPNDFQIAVKPGETTTVSVPLHRAVAIRGRVIDAQTRAGIQGVIVGVNCTIGESCCQIFLGATDADGKYTIYSVPGHITVSLTKAGDYVVGAREGMFQGVATEDFDCPVVELSRGNSVNGLVVDDQGKPVAGAAVFLEPSVGNPTGHLTPVATDAAGKFVFQGVPTKEALHLRARKGAAVSDLDTVLEPASKSAPLRLAISASKAFSLRGICVDEAGHPLPAADITVTCQWSSVGRSLNTEHNLTDATGRFQIQGLFPGDTHELRITTDGHATFHSNSITGSAGRTVDLGRLQLPSTGGQIEGVVLDSQGKPLAGVQVLHRGYTAQPPALTTDAAGRFCLRGFLPGPAYVFAVKDGYRFTGVRTRSGAGDVVVKLLRKNEPVPPYARPAQPVPAQPEQPQLARKILDQLWAGCRSDDDRLRVLIPLAKLDPSAALERTAKLGKEARQTARVAVALDVADRDLDEGLSQIGDDTQAACFLLFMLAERYETADPAAVMRWAEEVVFRARAADQPLRTEFLAQAAAVLGRSGANKVAGRKLAEEAAAMTLAIKSEDKRGQLCTPVAEALAAYDVDRATQFLKSIGPIGIADPDCLAHVAAAAATVDLAKARKILDLLPDKEAAEPARARMACRLAATRPAEALRLLDGPWHNTRLKAEALGWLALAAAPRDKPLACAAIDEGLALCNDPKAPSSWPVHRRAIQAAILAVQADQIGHPDMESVLYQVLAARCPGGETDNENETPAVALILSLVDPALARQLLLDVGDAPGNADLAGFAQSNHALWLAAWAMIDAKRADACFSRDCAAWKAGTVKDDTFQEWLLAAAEILTIRPSDRLHYLASRLGDSTLIEPRLW